MSCRALRLLITGLIGAAVAATAASAADLTVQQTPTQRKQTTAPPKRHDTAAKPAEVTTQAVTFGGLKTGNTLSPSTEAPLPASPLQAPTSRLNGLSLDSASLSPPPTAASGGASGPSFLTEHNGSIRYSVVPNSGFTPYVGLGAGRAAGIVGSGMSPTNLSDGNDGLHSYQGVAGFAYKLDKDTRLDLDYRMSNMQRPNVPMLDNANMADSERDRAAILSLHYDLDPILRPPPK